MAIAVVLWDLVAGVDGYNVYLRDNGEFVKHNTELITDLEYNIPSLDMGLYEVYVTSERAGVESDPSEIVPFGVNVEVFDEDFFDYPVSQYPSAEWRSLWDRTTFQVVVAAWSASNRAVEQNSEVNNRKDISWWAVGFVGDCEILQTVRTTNDRGNQCRLHLRTWGTQANEGVICLELYAEASGDRDARLRRFAYGVSSEGTTEFSFNWQANTVYHILGRLDGNKLYGKVWEDGEPEPEEWQIDVTITTDTHPDYGLVGFGSFFGASQYLSYIHLTKLGIEQFEDELTTLESAGNQQTGNTFIIDVGREPIKIDGLAFSMQTGEDTIVIRYREGDPVYEAAGWDLVHESGSIVGNNNGSADQDVMFSEPLVLEANTRYSFFVAWGDSAMMNYTNGSQTLIGDGFRYISDRGIGSRDLDTAPTFADRQWNGKIYYTK